MSFTISIGGMRLFAVCPYKNKFVYSFYEECIYFFSKDAANEIVCRHEEATDEYYNYLYHDIINMSETELTEKIKNTHAEYVLPFITVFLWKQRLGQISRRENLEVDEESISNLSGDYVIRRIHRMMSMSGYDDVYLKFPPNEELKKSCKSYLAFIEDLLGFHTKPGYDDDDYFSMLLDFLGIMGASNIKKYERYEEVIAFVEYILLNINTDERLHWIHLETLVFLLYCLNYNSGNSFSCFEKMIRKSDSTSALTVILGIKLFGDKACEIIKTSDYNYSYFGGFDNFFRLVMLE